MTIRQVYEEVGGDYDEVLARMLKEERVVKYLKRIEEEDYAHEIEEALAKEDYETAFRGAHNLKGVCANLGLSNLWKVASDLTETLRGGEPTVDVAPYFEAVCIEYANAIVAIRSL